MRNLRGFTVVELMIVIVAIGIITGLGVVNMRSNLADSRDDERRGDIQNIVTYLDSIYRSKGQYPSTTDLNTSIKIKHVFSGLDAESLRAPDTPDDTISLALATNSTQTVTGVTPQPAKDKYVYQPMRILTGGSWSYCLSSIYDCRKFNLYYMLESGERIKVTGKYQ